MSSIFARYPALVVEFGAAAVLVAALLARALSRRFGIPSIITLLTIGLALGPSGLDFLHLDLAAPATRALLSLCVVIVLFEATLRIDIGRLPKRPLFLLVIFGAGLTLIVIPHLARAFGLSTIVAAMLASACIVTGPTVTGPLLARLRLRPELRHLLESEGILLDAMGVIVAAATFTSFTTRERGPFLTALATVERLGSGAIVGLIVGAIGLFLLRRYARAWSSDVTKLLLLALAFGAYALGEFVAQESGLTAVIACALVVDFRGLPSERLLRSYKEDLSILALSTVFVLLASQIRIASVLPLVGVGAAIAGTLVLLRIVVVAIATARSALNMRERIFACTVFPRGIVAVSLATYYATQLTAWGFRGGNRFSEVLFVVIVLTVSISTVLSIVASRILRLRQPVVVLAGIDPASTERARALEEEGYVVVLADTDEASVAFARSQDCDAAFIESEVRIGELVRERGASVLLDDGSPRWNRLGKGFLPAHIARSLPLAEPRERNAQPG